ncbi:GAF domain-containing sensor histidine kinase [Perlabentimonas gracilis]|uniref:GAF domain-containing sensor histidine kinase n=1 Tax=Perlabentimonas gracilis TaxID=2715279 RepID=UPI0014074EC0|nr:GAF domain-containing sensor histidine kinase [Perlabentimonas gracilis]NHB70390.1 GAF domain-containing sensor histidine kinase [Perlabentimonas gracilis]
MNTNPFEDINEEILIKWQEMADLLAELLSVPSALIMKTENEFMEVFISSNSKNNPYNVGDKEKWYGLYCETVIKTQEKLLVPNALTDENWNKNPDIKLGMISYLGVPINFPDNKPFGTICVLDNQENYFSSNHERLIQQFKRVLELDLVLIQSNKELEKLNADKSIFLSILAHDIKSPLTSILGLSELLVKDTNQYDNEKIESFAKNIFDVASSTNNLLDDLLLWSTSQYGKLPFEPQKIEFYNICAQTISHLKSQSEKKEIEITISAPENISLWADENMLKTVFRNLVSNAIKFSNNGSKIEISAEKYPSNTLITVSDNGVGIDDDVQKKLFNISQSISNIGTMGEKGTGLGLILCKEFIEKHKGEIWVESKVGRGSNFKFTLPNEN